MKNYQAMKKGGGGATPQTRDPKPMIEQRGRKRHALDIQRMPGRRAGR